MSTMSPGETFTGFHRPPPWTWGLIKKMVLDSVQRMSERSRNVMKHLVTTQWLSARHGGLSHPGTGCLPDNGKIDRMACMVRGVGGCNLPRTQIVLPFLLSGAFPFVDRGHNVVQYPTWQAQQITATKPSVKRKWVCLVIELEQGRWGMQERGGDGLLGRENRTQKLLIVRASKREWRQRPTSIQRIREDLWDGRAGWFLQLQEARQLGG